MGHRIDYNGLGALRDQGTYPAKIYPSALPPPPLRKQSLTILFSKKE